MCFTAGLLVQYLIHAFSTKRHSKESASSKYIMFEACSSLAKLSILIDIIVNGNYGCNQASQLSLVSANLALAQGQIWSLLTPKKQDGVSQNANSRLQNSSPQTNGRHHDARSIIYTVYVSFPQLDE